MSAGIGASVMIVAAAASTGTAFAASGGSGHGAAPTSAVQSPFAPAKATTGKAAAPAAPTKAAPAKPLSTAKAAAAAKKVAIKQAPVKPAGKTVSKPAASETKVHYANNLDGWIAQARAILKADGDNVPSASAIKARAMTESSGNPYAENHWDENQALYGGTFGLLQTIKPTFAKWSLPGHKDIYNPVDSIIAGVRYANDRYGDFTHVAYTKAGY